MHAHRDGFTSNSTHGRWAKKAHKSYLIFPIEANQKRQLKCSWKLMPFHSCYVCYSLQYSWFILNMGTNKRGKSRYFSSDEILEWCKITQGDKALCCFTNFFKDLGYSDFRHVWNHSRREILGLNCSRYHCAAVSVNYIRRSLGEGALLTTYYSHMWFY